MTEALPEGIDDALLERVAATFHDLGALCRIFKIRTKNESIVDFGPDRWFPEQRDFDRNRTGRDVVLKARQIGFSTLELARDLQYALTHPGRNVVVLAHDRDLSEKLFRTVRLFHESLDEVGLAPRPRYDTVREIYYRHLHSGVRIVESGGSELSASKKGRSGTIHRLHATELAFWSYPYDTMRAILSCVPEDGEIVIESTPNGAQGMFYDLCRQARAGRGPYKLHFFPWWQHGDEYAITPPPGFDPAPRDRWEERLVRYGVSAGQLAWWRRRVDDPQMGLESMLQEFPIDFDSCFRAPGGAWLPPEIVDAMAEDIREPIAEIHLRGAKLRLYETPNARRGRGGYIVGGDVSEGVGRDGSALTVLDRVTADPVATWFNDRIEPGDFGLALADVAKLFGQAEIIVERNNHGAATIRALTNEARYDEALLYKHDDGRIGWPTNQATRPVLFDEMYRGIVGGHYRTPDAETVGECRTLIRNPDENNRPEAMGKADLLGCTDDRFVSWGLAHQCRVRPKWTPASGRVKGA